MEERAVAGRVGESDDESHESVEEQLDRLQRESEARRAELRAIAAELPEARSRREIVVTMARDARANADVGDIVTRAFRKLARAPRAVGRRLRRS